MHRIWLNFVGRIVMESERIRIALNILRSLTSHMETACSADFMNRCCLISPFFVLLSTCALVVAPAQAQVRGGYESFTSVDNAESWGLYDYSDGQLYIPAWDFSQIDNPEIYGFVAPNSSISLFADSLSSDASFIGDFSAQNIAGLSCDAYIDNANSLLGTDFYFVSGGDYYYSGIFVSPDYFSADGWDYLEVSFGVGPWFVFQDGDFVGVEITDAILSTVTEVGVDFFSTSDASEDIIVAIDNFTLIPELIVPQVSIVKNGSNIDLGFQRSTGQIYDILDSPDLSGWVALTGQSSITGSGPYTASESLTDRNFFKVETEAFFTPIPDIGASP